MTESACMANAPLSESMLQSLSHFKNISPTLDTVTLDESGIHNTVLGNQATLTRNNAPVQDITDQTNYSLDAGQPPTEDITYNDHASLTGEFLVQLILEHVRTADRI